MNASIVNVYLQEMDKNILWAENSPKQDVGCCSCGDLMSQRVACPFILFMLIFMVFFSCEWDCCVQFITREVWTI